MPIRAVTSQPAMIAVSNSRPDRASRSAIASAGGNTSGITCVKVARCVSHIVTAVTRNPLSKVAPASDERPPPDDRRFLRLREHGCEGGDLRGLLALVAGERTGQSIEQSAFRGLANALGNHIKIE